MGPASVFLPSLVLGVVVTILAGTIFLGLAAKGRRVASDHKEADLSDPSHEETEHSNSRADVGVQDIFLSHSGRQKSFVESLYNALRRANHTAFFDKHELPKGFPFPPYIEQAARGCKLGVVVLSKAFLTSKWPMKELEMLVLQRGPKPCVLPLFYELNPADLKDPKNLKKWRREWKRMEGENVAQRWELAVKKLKHFNGEVFIQGTSEDAYIRRVVKLICSLISCHVPYDSSWIQGLSRLVQVIASRFEQLDACQLCKVGLHGVGGLGKTTLCKAMVNYYSSDYHGRSFLIEFPSPGVGDLSTIILECKKALQNLTNASSDHPLNKTDSFDQVVQLMRDRIGGHDVFVAIDNVWEGFLEEAKRILRVGFSPNSKVLVTSRSEEALKDLLVISGDPIFSNASVAPLPAPKREEAFQIFQETFELCDLRALVDSSQIDQVLKKCWFSGSYHALALKAFGKYVKRACMNLDPEGIKKRLSSILIEFSSVNLQDVEDVIRLSYDILPPEKKHVFLGIAVCLKKGRMFETCADPQEMIRKLYWNSSESKTTVLINELSLDGLLQIEIDENVENKIRLHDMYVDLALREVARSPRFLIEEITKSVEKIEWEKLQIVFLKGVEPGPGLFEKLQQCKCPELKLLRATDIEIKSGIRLNSMPSLRMLVLKNIRIVENEHGSSSTVSGSGSKKERVVQSHLVQPLEQVLGMASLEYQEGTVKNSRTGFERGPEGLVDASRILFLHGLVRLQHLVVEWCNFVEEIAGLGALGNLQTLRIQNCGELKSVDGLSGLAQLQVLCVSECTRLQKLPDMSSLTCLESLKLLKNDALEELGGLSHTLKTLRIDGCEYAKTTPDVSSLTCFNWTCLTNLEYLVLNFCLVEEIEDISALRSLKSLEIYTCTRLKKLNVACASLEALWVCNCHALEEITRDDALPSLEVAVAEDCPSLKKKFEGISSSFDKLPALSTIRKYMTGGSNPLIMAKLAGLVFLAGGGRN